MQDAVKPVLSCMYCLVNLYYLVNVKGHNKLCNGTFFEITFAFVTLFN